MEKVTVKQTLTVPGGTVGITKEQAARRAHCLEKAEKQPTGLDKGFQAFTVTKQTQFKVGEELYLEEVAKGLFTSVTVQGEDEGTDGGAKKDDGKDGGAKKK